MKRNRGAVRPQVEEFNEGIRKFQSDGHLKKKNVSIEMESRVFF
jgi:hypothetical protein